MARYSKIPTVELVAVCDWALRVGRPMPEEVAAHFKITVKQARDLVKSRRQHGAAIPYVFAPKPRTEPLMPAKMPMAAGMLACECGECFPLDVLELARHTLATHRRVPTRTERTPRKVAA